MSSSAPRSPDPSDWDSVLRRAEAFELISPLSQFSFEEPSVELSEIREEDDSLVHARMPFAHRLVSPEGFDQTVESQIKDGRMLVEAARPVIRVLHHLLIDSVDLSPAFLSDLHQSASFMTVRVKNGHTDRLVLPSVVSIETLVEHPECVQLVKESVEVEMPQELSAEAASIVAALRLIGFDRTFVYENEDRAVLYVDTSMVSQFLSGVSKLLWEESGERLRELREGDVARLFFIGISKNSFTNRALLELRADSALSEDEEARLKLGDVYGPYYVLHDEIDTEILKRANSLLLSLDLLSRPEYG